MLPATYPFDCCRFSHLVNPTLSTPLFISRLGPQSSLMIDSHQYRSNIADGP